MSYVAMAWHAATLAGVLSVLSACGIQGLQDQHSVDVVISEQTGGRRISMPGSFPTFDARIDCIPNQLNAVGQCLKPTLQYFPADRSVSSPELVALRNEFQDYLLWRSDQQCERHKSSIVSTQSSVNFGLNVAVTGLSAAAAIVTTPATNLLAALAAGLSGTRSHFNEDFYRQFVGPAVVKRISLNRSEFYAWLMSKRGTPLNTSPLLSVMPPGAAVKDVPGAATANTTGKSATYREVPLNEYSVWAAIDDVEQYQALCSFLNGLASLVEPGPTFGDTAAGIQLRIDALRSQIAINDALSKSLGATNLTAQELMRLNETLARQMMVLQHRLLTAPTTVGMTKG